jgi:pimeloyl-ACP methyl ester carboxylesterase
VPARPGTETAATDARRERAAAAATQNSYEYRHPIPALSAHYRVICPDLRGFGWSDAPPQGYEKCRLVRDLLALLDALEVDRSA